jgi:hypothetical protein
MVRNGAEDMYRGGRGGGVGVEEEEEEEEEGEEDEASVTSHVLQWRFMWIG